MSDEFKSLVGLLLAPEPGARPTMADVLGHAWMRGEVATKADFVARFGPIMQGAISARDGGQEALDVDFQIATAGRRQAMRGVGATVIDANWAKGREFRPVVPSRLGQQCATFTVLGEPLEIMGALRDLLGDYDKNVTLSKRGWRASCTARLQALAVEGEEAKDAVVQEENKDGEWATGPGAEI